MGHKKLATVAVALTVMGILAGCGTRNGTTSATKGNNTSVSLRNTVSPNNRIGNTRSRVPTTPMVIRKLTDQEKNSMHQLQGPNAVWQDGNWVNPKNANLNGPRYVMSGMLQPENNRNSPHTVPAIIIYRENAAAYGGGRPEETIYKCPKNIGDFNITDISKDGTVLYWKSDKGQSGTFNLKSYKWSFK